MLGEDKTAAGCCLVKQRPGAAAAAGDAKGGGTGLPIVGGPVRAEVPTGVCGGATERPMSEVTLAPSSMALFAFVGISPSDTISALLRTSEAVGALSSLLG